MQWSRLPRAGAMMLALLTAALPGAASAQVPAADDLVEVRSVTFDGAEQLPEALLRTAIATAPTLCISDALQPL